jgi:hypothetical protein
MTDLTVEQRQDLPELTERQKRAAAELNPYQLEFARRWLERHVSGDSEAACYLAAYPNASDYKGASVNAGRILKLPKVQEFIEAMQETGTLKSTVATLEEIQEQLTETIRADITEIVEWDTTDAGEPIPVIKNLSELEPRLRRLVKSITWTKNGPKIELHDASKAQDMLIRMQGGYKDRLELGGSVVSATVELDASDPLKAAADYTAMIRGLDAAGGKR